ncbi:MAG: aminoacyl-histidine dipeptidase [Rikenellaceae bacterium]|nr:aminoacyl-histidine dipeptidase [Rikenellaceae bacterium]MCL2692451.1 aminoacyl-histidine dipeptidase [Rikenellaceae bacterium]
MNKNIKSLAPEIVWKHFAEICAIPHPSGHEEEIRKYIINFAKQHGLEYIVDEADNIIVRKPATPGMEDRMGIVLQAHLDMVPQKNGDKVFDFEKDPIETYIDGEWVTANGTTLGADNGIGAAAALAVLEAKDIKHGPIEVLLTATEETGMVGAFGLRGGELRGDIMLNTDSETEGELYVGCAGGLDANVTFEYKEDKTDFAGRTALAIEVKGLRGGHSGMEIILQRANANKLLFRFLLSAWERYDMQLASVDGGGLRNAIPREGKVVVYVPTSDAARFRSDLAAFEKTVITEFDGIEDSISIKAVDAQRGASVIDRDTAKRLTKAVCGCPNGVITMSIAMHGLVQTSSNLARVVSENGEIKLQALLRSSVNSEKEYLAECISSVFELAGAKVVLAGGYDGWKPNMNSPILKAMQEVYKVKFGKTPEIMAIHAGLECGIIGGKYPKLDMISFGPTIRYPHSPDEKVEIASVAKFWDFMKATLENAPKK